jgi:energy-coupling factor transporter ATP-binding protein EcfA2
MKIRKFQSTGLNGYLDFDIDLFDSRNFLIGINGSGKTSVLKAIMGLITPDIDWLMNAKFESISVHLEYDGKDIIINSSADGDGKKLSFSVNENTISSGFISSMDYRGMLRYGFETVHEDDGDIIRLHETSVDPLLGIDVVKEIKKIPTPLFLGLDRSNLPFAKKMAPRRTRPSRMPHATLRAFLDESVGHAEQAVSQARIRANVKRLRRASQLRESMLLALFSTPQGQKTVIPSKKTYLNTKNTGKI